MRKLIPLTVLTVILYPCNAFAASEEGTSGSLLMVVAYILLWAVVGLYLGFLGLRQRRLNHELHHLRKKIDKELGLTDEHEEYP